MLHLDVFTTAEIQEIISYNAKQKSKPSKELVLLLYQLNKSSAKKTSKSAQSKSYI